MTPEVCRMACRRSELRGEQRVVALLLLQWCHAEALRISAKNIAKAVDNGARRVRGYILDNVESGLQLRLSLVRLGALRLLQGQIAQIGVQRSNKHG